MQIIDLLEFTNRKELRQWLVENHLAAKECWVTVNRGKQERDDCIPYVEVVEEALCFGWIDSTVKRLPDGRCAQRLSPRRKKKSLDRTQPATLPQLERTWLDDSGWSAGNAGGMQLNCIFAS